MTEKGESGTIMPMEKKGRSLPGQLLGDPDVGFLAFAILALTLLAAVVAHFIG